jgi:hypothetical protein
MREYDNINTYWHINTVDKFVNIEVHGIIGDVKYLCCIGCQNEILGYQLISVSVFRELSMMAILECRTPRRTSLLAPGLNMKFDFLSFNLNLS